MSTEKYIVFVIAILAYASSSVVAKPNAMRFSIAKNQTICRTKVKYDVNVDRIPKTIKMLKCEDDPYEMCPTKDGTSTPCCGALSVPGAPKFSCTELQDEVLVKTFNTNEKEYDVIKVSIGCSCISQNSTAANEKLKNCNTTYN